MAPFMEKFFALIREDFTKKGIALVNNIHAAAEWALADPHALQQVLLNIMANAADSLIERADPAITVALKAVSGGVLLQITDNGCGMTDKQQEDLFKPFYTSKQHGTGLGLVIVKKMLARMNGTIDVRSRKDVGTSIEITLPGGSGISGNGKND
jgi:C4-dicarboxylate-specific signal transduction histidine kinase